MNLYHYTENDKILNLHHYVDGAYYKKYSVKNGMLIIKNEYASRHRTIEQEEQYLIELLYSLKDPRTLIMHNHVDPINPEILNRLTELASENIYIHRLDKRQQLASYVIAYSTKQFSAWNKSAISDEVVSDINPIVIENLMNRIKSWDKLQKNGKIVTYEETLEDSTPVPILKQNTNHYSRISTNMIDLIERLVIEYENDSTNR
jgi:hypothetical protein